ncbi:MAG: carbonic anhydrase [Magnetococcales bacterium]|nr:carbonic anhydrase [Magnetococcales bacterium]
MCDFFHNPCSRRHLLSGIGAGSLLLSLPAVTLGSSDAMSSVSPDEALQWLKNGNQRFVSNKMEHPNLCALRLAETVKGGQHPFATILSCSDSRVPVEYIFDRGVGDLFVIRVAGNVADTDEIGTIEYGAGHLGTRLVVVMGHTRCGAVTAVVKGDRVGGNIPKLVDNIIPAATRVKSKSKDLSESALILEAIKENIRQAISDIQKNSQEMAHLIQGKKVRVVGALYDLETGRVEWL